MALRDDHYRVEIVANLTAYLAGTGGYERLTLTAERIRTTAVPRLYDVPLADLIEEVRVVSPPTSSP